MLLYHRGLGRLKFRLAVSTALCCAWGIEFVPSVLPSPLLKIDQYPRANWSPQTLVWGQTAASPPAAGFFLPRAKCRVCGSPRVRRCYGCMYGVAYAVAQTFRFVLCQDAASRHSQDRFKIPAALPTWATYRKLLCPHHTLSASKHEFSDFLTGESFVDENISPERVFGIPHGGVRPHLGVRARRFEL